VKAAALSLGLMGSAHAGDLGNTGLNDPIPDKMSWHGITIYGTVDVGYAYQTHGAPLGGAFYPSLEYNLNGSKNANRAISSLAENGWSSLRSVSSSRRPLDMAGSPSGSLKPRSIRSPANLPMLAQA
jgi:hypothetical protein